MSIRSEYSSCFREGCRKGLMKVERKIGIRTKIRFV